jgi:H+/Cl- antiporter ClcA
VYGGGGGGVFTSLACTGLFLSVLLERLLGHPPGGPLALIGSATFLASGYRLPLAGMLLVAEHAGDFALTVAGVVAVAIGQAVMGDASVSDAQRDGALTRASETVRVFPSGLLLRASAAARSSARPPAVRCR